MKLIHFLILLVIPFSNKLYSQSKILVKVVDSEENLPIADAQLVIEGQTDTITTNNKGYAEILAKEAELLVISKEGQKLTMLLLDSLQNMVIKIQKPSLTSDSHYILVDDRWQEAKLDKVPSLGEHKEEFLHLVYKKLKYPAKTRNNLITGIVYLAFEVDTLGNVSNFIVSGNMDKDSEKEVAKISKLIPINWIPAEKDGKTYTTKVVQPFEFRIENDGTKITNSNSINQPMGYVLEPIVITAFSIFSSKRVIHRSRIRN